MGRIRISENVFSRLLAVAAFLAIPGAGAFQSVEFLSSVSVNEVSSHDTETNPGPGFEAAQTQGAGVLAAQASGVGKRTAQEQGTGKATAAATAVGHKAAKASGTGSLTAQRQGRGRATAEWLGAGKATAAEEGSGRKTAAAAALGHKAAKASGAGALTAQRQGRGRATAEWLGAGKATAAAQGAGKKTAAATALGHKAAKASHIGTHEAAVEGAGKATAVAQHTGQLAAHDNHTGQLSAHESGAGIRAALSSGEGVTIAVSAHSGIDSAHASAIGKAPRSGPHQCKLPRNISSDAGFPDDFAGWYDVQNCGLCNDYCRWVGANGSGGDPSISRDSGRGAYWSCSLAGSDSDHTPAGMFASWAKPKCAGEAAVAPCMAPIYQGPQNDTGFTDSFQGWYDVQGCGTCNDYCRWVGSLGTGGDPTKRLVHNKAWWSCALAGSDTMHTPLGTYGSWDLPKCAGKGAPAPVVLSSKDDKVM